MRFLLVLFVVLVAFLLTLAVLAGVSYGLGRYLHTRQIVTAGAGEADAWTQCNADRDWYHALPLWEKAALMGWWLVNRYTWAVKGYK
jgi:hypothetical protein